MGLDMYLTRRTYIGARHPFNNITGNVNIKKDGKILPIDMKNVSYIEENVAYWRKANHIHKFFVDKVQDGEDDCGVYDLSIATLKELLDLCKEVKEKAIIKQGNVKNGETLKDGKWIAKYEKGKVIENAEEISKILPTQDGFFFGNTDYDEYYLDEIDYTIDIIEKEIERDKELDDMNIFSYLQYSSSW